MGCIFYEVVTGRIAFSTDDALKDYTGPEHLLSATIPDFHYGLSARFFKIILGRMLDCRSPQRPSAESLVDDFWDFDEHLRNGSQLACIEIPFDSMASSTLPVSYNSVDPYTSTTAVANSSSTPQDFAGPLRRLSNFPRPRLTPYPNSVNPSCLGQNTGATPSPISARLRAHAKLYWSATGKLKCAVCRRKQKKVPADVEYTFNL